MVVFLWWCSCGGRLVVVVFLGRRFCGRFFAVVFLWWCFCGVFVVVVFVCFFWSGVDFRRITEKLRKEF